MAGKDADNWVLASWSAAVNRSPFQADIVGMSTYGVTTGTEKRDISEVLDLLALAETPFINAVGWGSESSGTVIEWISEDLGPGYVQNLSAVASGAAGSILANSVDAVQGSQLTKQLHAGTILYVYGSADARHGIGVVTSEPNGTLFLVSFLHLDTYATGLTTILAGNNFYILGNAQNEGSRPGRAKPRVRTICTNEFSILRRDVSLTGSMQKTAMYAIGSEDQHQIMLRMKEIQRERERMSLYSIYSAKTSLLAGLMNGVFGFLTTQTGNHIDRSTKTLTETAFNTVTSKIWESGGRNLTTFGHIDQTAKFTRWDKNRIRMRVNDGLGGGHITSYLTEAGIEIDLVPMGNVPTNLMFILDTARIKLRAKSGRKALLEKLGKMGDAEDWQILSEFSMEMKGYNTGQHGCFSVLA
jgi:hypothetical protein